MSITASRTTEYPSDVATASATALCDTVIRLHEGLSRLANLVPASDADAIFHELVRVCIDAGNEAAASVLADARIRRLRPDLLRLCSEGESLLEAAWARRVGEAGDPPAELDRFPYLENYRRLSRLELHTLAGAGHVPLAAHRVCFLGGGPLPVSGLLMRQQLGVTVDVVEKEPLAADLARRLLGRLAPGPGLRVVEADAASAEDMAQLVPGCDVVVMAALVGPTRDEKREVLRAVGRAMDPGAYLVARSAHGLRSLLYPVVEPGDVEAAGCVPHVLVHPLSDSDVINSVLVARRRLVGLPGPAGPQAVDASAPRHPPRGHPPPGAGRRRRPAEAGRGCR